MRKGVAQALGKKGIVLQPQQTGHTAPKVPLEGMVQQQASSLYTVAYTLTAQERLNREA